MPIESINKLIQIFEMLAFIIIINRTVRTICKPNGLKFAYMQICNRLWCKWPNRLIDGVAPASDTSFENK